MAQHVKGRVKENAQKQAAQTEQPKSSTRKSEDVSPIARGLLSLAFVLLGVLHVIIQSGLV